MSENGDFTKRVGSNIKLARQKRGFSQTEVAMLAGISNSFISEFEKGNRGMSPENLMNICRILNITIDAVLNEDFAAGYNWIESKRRSTAGQVREDGKADKARRNKERKLNTYIQAMTDEELDHLLSFAVNTRKFYAQVTKTKETKLEEMDRDFKY